MAKTALSLHPFDNPKNWATGGFDRAPWPQEKIAEFQRRIDSAFGAEKAIVLVWSGDRSYGDELYVDWHANGLPKGRPEKKPVLLFGEWKVNDKDYLYIVPPRWCLMEVHHGSQLEDSWEESRWVSDPDMIGGRKCIRPERPPEFYYVHLNNAVLAHHEHPLQPKGVPPCCKRLWDEDKRICFGLYRDPDFRDIEMIGGIRANQDKAGVSQRNDTKRDAKVVQRANLTTRHFMKQMEIGRSRAAKDLILSAPRLFLGDVLDRLGNTMSNAQLEKEAKKILTNFEERRFAKI